MAKDRFPIHVLTLESRVREMMLIKVVLSVNSPEDAIVTTSGLTKSSQSF